MSVREDSLLAMTNDDKKQKSTKWRNLEKNLNFLLPKFDFCSDQKHGMSLYGKLYRQHENML